MQRFTSANTSVNSGRMPKIYSLASDLIKGKSVIDYGCGKYFDNYLGNVDCDLHGYDKYNRPDESEIEGEYDIALCSNVLNVIAERDERIKVLRELKRLAPKVLITVYEGDRSGNGRETKADCYQLNRNASEYNPEITEVFEKVTWSKKRFWICERKTA